MMNSSLSKNALAVLIASFWLLHSPAASAFSVGEFWERITAREFAPEYMAQAVTKGVKDEREKARRIYSWITENIVYDVQAHRLGSQTVQSLEELMRVKKGVCEDYAQLFQLMASTVGLRSSIVNGFVHDPTSPTSVSPHSWNQLQLGGRTYVVDTTWGAGAYDPVQRKYTPRKDERYFLADPTQILLTHREEDENGSPRELPGFTFEQFRQMQPNTRRLARLGLSTEQLIARLGEAEQRLPLAQESADASLRIHSAPLQKPGQATLATFEVTHSPGTRLFVRTAVAEIEFQPASDTRSVLAYDFGADAEVRLLYKMPDKGYFELLRY